MIDTDRTAVLAGVEQAWAGYKASGSKAARDALIVHYTSLVRQVASRVSAGMPNTVEHADLVSYGVFGLIDAIDKFEPSRGIKFETYAVARVKGAMIDELRAIDWVPRSVRSKARSVEEAFSKLEGTLGRAPTDAELASAMGISEGELHDVFTQVSVSSIVPLDEPLGAARDDSTTLGDTLADGDAGPVEAVEVEDSKQVLAGAINLLADRDKLVLTLYYYEGLTLAEIGHVLGVTESRVCQIHTKAVVQLRSKLAHVTREAV
ncbi:MAG: FliA/WhiG family RNA polymerase sigma factor [Acidimicrobiales bacterium]